MLLAALAGGLLVIFQGDTHRLIPLFAVGAFLAFTLSQSGMVVHWLRLRGSFWTVKALLNGLGAAATGAALAVIIFSKFVHGAWVVILLIPLFVVGFRAIRSHYNEIGRQLHLVEQRPVFHLVAPRVVVPVAGVHRGVIEALRYARSITQEVTAVYIELEPGTAVQAQERWRRYGLDEIAPMVVVVLCPLVCATMPRERDFVSPGQRVAGCCPMKWCSWRCSSPRCSARACLIRMPLRAG